MKYKYICRDCERDIPWDEQFCSECGGGLRELTETLEHYNEKQGTSQSAVSQLSETKETPTVATTIKSYLISCESCSKQFSKRAEACPKCGWKPQEMCQI